MGKLFTGKCEIVLSENIIVTLALRHISLSLKISNFIIPSFSADSSHFKSGDFLSVFSPSSSFSPIQQCQPNFSLGDDGDYSWPELEDETLI